MNTSSKVLLDIEGRNGIPGIYMESDKEVVLAGKNIISISENEASQRIYKLIKENCHIIFCTTQEIEDFQFYPVPCFFIFAVDSLGSCFGTIGGIGNLLEDDFPIGYVGHDGSHGKIANSLKEFLELITFYPYWQDIIKNEKKQLFYDLNHWEAEKRERNLKYLTNQKEIVETLKLSYNPQSVDLLVSNLKDTSNFVIYQSKNEAKNTNTFWELDF